MGKMTYDEAKEYLKNIDLQWFETFNKELSKAMDRIQKLKNEWVKE